MKRCVWCSLVLFLVFASASGAVAQPVKTVRVVLPEQADAVVRNIAGVLARQVAQRCDAIVVADGEAPLNMELSLAPGIGTEGFRIEDRPGGGVKIIGNDARGLLYGVGKLLRTSRNDGFAPLEGKLDEVSVYDRALSADEIVAHHAASRPVSRESVQYLQRLRKNTPFGTSGFDLAALRAGMGSRREPTIQGVKLTRVMIGDIPCEFWPILAAAMWYDPARPKLNSVSLTPFCASVPS